MRKRFKPFVEDELPLLAKETFSLVAHPEAVAQCPRDVKRPVTLAIGPEGGWTPYEIDKLTDCGFLPINMGKRILRVESAIPAIISKLF